MLDSLADILGLDRLTHVVDIGAAPIDGPPPYRSLVEAGLCRVTGFDPQIEESRSGCHSYRSEAIGDGNEHTLNMCAYPGWASLFRPSAAALECFPFFKPNGTVIGQTTVATRRLDDVPLAPVDFLKMDVQGSELLVLTHGRETLKNVVAVQTEIQFIELYDGQPSFAQVDTELRTQGFVPHAFAAVKQWPIGPTQIHDNPTKPFNQLLEADLVYVRDFVHPEAISTEQLKHLCLIAHGCYGSFDLAARCLWLLGQRGDLPLAEEYAARITGATS